jgi:hypothetical protein
MTWLQMLGIILFLIIVFPKLFLFTIGNDMAIFKNSVNYLGKINRLLQSID